MRRRRCWGHTEADQDPLESLVGRGLQVKQGQLVVGAVLGFMADGLKESRRSVELKQREAPLGGELRSTLEKRAPTSRGQQLPSMVTTAAYSLLSF